MSFFFKKLPVPCHTSTKNMATIGTAKIVPILIPNLSISIIFHLMCTDLMTKMTYVYILKKLCLFSFIINSIINSNIYLQLQVTEVQRIQINQYGCK